MKLTLGPIPFLWEKERIQKFYKEVADTPLSVVYLGEVVCNKRALLDPEDWAEIARGLERAGKAVVLSTLGIMTHEGEMAEMESLCSLPYPVEVNHMGVLNRFLGEPRDFIAGPHIAVYNGHAARFLRGLGVRRMVFMPELARESMVSVCEEAPEIEKELIVYGHLPLAFSWRCYTARAMDLAKDNCGIVCRKYPEGMPLDTLDGQPIFNLNGTQLVSAQKHCLLEHLESVREMGVEYLRIIPQVEGTAGIVDLFHRTLSGHLTGGQAMERLSPYLPFGNGWFFGRPGWEYVGAGR